MKKLARPLLISICLIASLSSSVVASGASPIYIDNRPVVTSLKPINVQGNTLVPLRMITEELGCDVTYNAAQKKVEVKRDTATIELWIGQHQAKVNGQTAVLEVAPLIKEGSTMVPLRFLATALGFDISYDAVEKTIKLNTANVVEGKNTAPGSSTVAQTPVAADNVDEWGNKVRTTNLPANAKMFPYIREGVPNWAYERLAYAWNDNGWGPENNPARPANQRKLLDSPAELWNSPAGTKEIWNKEFATDTAGKKWNTDECLKSMINAQLNVDYRKIDNVSRGTLPNVINDTVSPYSMKNSDIKQATGLGGGYQKYAKENEVIISSEFTPLYEASWKEYNNGEYVLMLPVVATVNFEHIKTGHFYDFYGHYNTNGMSDKDSIKNFKTGDKVTSIITYKLFHNPKTGQWQFWYGDMNPIYQIMPSCNQYEGVSPTDRVGKYVGGWVYQWMKDEAKPLGRYQTDYDTDAIKKIFTE